MSRSIGTRPSAVNQANPYLDYPRAAKPSTGRTGTRVEDAVTSTRNSDLGSGYLECTARVLKPRSTSKPIK